mmetsp:Transcript_41011/g.89616  ORF Transcript_41011/g.89616 Transcript_41011/m.89616 type:complete len:390 (-) Transcript_41011:163-1332(-)
MEGKKIAPRATAERACPVAESRFCKKSEGHGSPLALVSSWPPRREELEGDTLRLQRAHEPGLSPCGLHFASLPRKAAYSPLGPSGSALEDGFSNWLRRSRIQVLDPMDHRAALAGRRNQHCGKAHLLTRGNACQFGDGIGLPRRGHHKSASSIAVHPPGDPINGVTRTAGKPHHSRRQGKLDGLAKDWPEAVALGATSWRFAIAKAGFEARVVAQHLLLGQDDPPDGWVPFSAILRRQQHVHDVGWKHIRNQDLYVLHRCNTSRAASHILGHRRGRPLVALFAGVRPGLVRGESLAFSVPARRLQVLVRALERLQEPGYCDGGIAGLRRGSQGVLGSHTAATQTQSPSDAHEEGCTNEPGSKGRTATQRLSRLRGDNAEGADGFPPPTL